MTFRSSQRQDLSGGRNHWDRCLCLDRAPAGGSGQAAVVGDPGGSGRRNESGRAVPEPSAATEMTAEPIESPCPLRARRGGVWSEASFR